MQGALLGTQYNDSAIEKILVSAGASYNRYSQDELLDNTSSMLVNEKVVGWFQGRMEYGPRALGSRSILGDSRSVRMQSLINLKIKYRESFRPFAPAVLREKLSHWFDTDEASEYMLFVARLKKDKCLLVDETALSGLDKLKQRRSLLPAITHVDNSARVQTVSKASNSMFYQLLKKFDQNNDCPVLINTSFNVRGEPIVESPYDALRCFMKTEMDVLAIGSFMLFKKDQPADVLDFIRTEDALKCQQKNLKPDVSEKELRQFSISTGIVVALLFGCLIPWMLETPVKSNVLMFALGWIVWGITLPKTLTLIYKGWMRFGMMMNKITTPLILSIIYFLLIFPAGLIMRLSGNDPLSRKLNKTAKSYRIKSIKDNIENLRKPF